MNRKLERMGRAPTAGQQNERNFIFFLERDWC